MGQEHWGRHGSFSEEYGSQTRRPGLVTHFCEFTFFLFQKQKENGEWTGPCSCFLLHMQNVTLPYSSHIQASSDPNYNHHDNINRGSAEHTQSTFSSESFGYNYDKHGYGMPDSRTREYQRRFSDLERAVVKTQSKKICTAGFGDKFM